MLPILFIGGLLKPISNQSIIINDYLRYLGKEEAKMPHDDVLVVQIRTPDYTFVLATCGEHASGLPMKLSCLTLIIFWTHGML